MSKDQALGGAILVVCALVAIFYVVTLFYPSLFINIADTIGWKGLDSFSVQFWLIAIPVFVAFIAIMMIGAWIGYTMATTPPPKPIEEITSEMEEKKEEPKMEEPAPPAPAAPANNAPEKKKKA